MQYLISFLEGVITFISPCLLPMLPVYLSYFAGGNQQFGSRRKTFVNALGFVAGFTLVFVILGAFAGSVGLALKRHTEIVNVVTGLIVILFGLNFMGVIRIGFLNAAYRKNANVQNLGFGSSLLFGMVFSVGWTPCVGAFLGSALMMAAKQGSTLQGIGMLLCYSLGLGIPFIASALILNQLQSAFVWIKTHYRTINLISGGLLVIVGVLMATGLMGRLLLLLSF